MKAISPISRSLLISLGILVSGAAGAANGVVTLDQSKALNGNTAPGDAPGFPIRISHAGSYRLESNLTAPDASTDVIQIAVSNVTIDLNGFSIIGPCPNCTFTSNTTGAGIRVVTAGARDIIIRNGSISGVGGDGLNLQASSVVVDQVSIDNCDGNGVVIGNVTTAPFSGDGEIRNSSASNNQGKGILQANGIVHHNVVQGNVSGGIVLRANGLVSNNAVFNNGNGNSIELPNLGIEVDGLTGACGGNVLSNNSFNCPAVTEQNSCQGTICGANH
jgi:hypothetical protein